MTAGPRRAALRLRRAVARTVPARGDRWWPLGAGDGPPADRRAAGPDATVVGELHTPPDLPGGLAGFLAAAAPGTAPAEGVLDVRGLRCDVLRTDGVRSGVLRGRRGRPLDGPGGLLDLARAGRPGPAPRRTVVLDVPVAVLDLRARSAENYFHLHVDALASRWLIERAAPGPGPVRWLLPQGPAAWQAEAVRLAGLDDAVIPLDDVDRILAPRFLVPVRGLGSRSVPDWTVTALRAVGGQVPSVAGAARRLHVARTDATRRRLRGEDVLADRLARLGFTTVTLGGMSVAEQRGRFAAADVIVASHGAALTNLAWARPGAAVLELLPAARPNLAYRRLAAQAGVVHHGLICAPADRGADPHGDMVVDVDRALRIVEALVAGTA